MCHLFFCQKPFVGMTCIQKKGLNCRKTYFRIQYLNEDMIEVRNF
jgi:hypothetical protein